MSEPTVARLLELLQEARSLQGDEVNDTGGARLTLASWAWFHDVDRLLLAAGRLDPRHATPAVPDWLREEATADEAAEEIGTTR